MAKKSKKPEGWDPTAPSESPFDVVFETATDVQKKTYPDSVYSGGQAAMRIVCLPVPSFAVRFLLQQEGWPLSRFVMLVGEQESCKSAMLSEIMRWHMTAMNGGAIYIENERKLSPELIHSIVGYNPKRLRFQECRTLQEWNAALKNWIASFHLAMDGCPGGGGQAKTTGIGRKSPICFGIDSLMAALTDKQNEKIDDEGTSAKHFADAAGLLNDYFKNITHDLANYPFSLVGINHMKPRQVPVAPNSPAMKMERNISGGFALKFHDTAEIQMTRLSNPAPGKELNRIADNEKGIELRISVFKNSMAPHEKIDVDMMWYTDYEDRDPLGHYRQKTFFDWDAAAIEILAALTTGDGKQAKRLRAIIDLELEKDTRKVWCSALGIAQKSKVRYREAGKILEHKLANDEQFRNSLYAECGIRRRFLFRPDLDFREQIELASSVAIPEDELAALASQNIFSATATGATDGTAGSRPV